jgi:PKD domain
MHAVCRSSERYGPRVAQSTSPWEASQGSAASAGAARRTIDARGGIDQGTLNGSLSIPFTAHGLEPTVSAGGNETIAVGAFTRSGSFTDIGNGQTWTATVDFGDGSGAQPLVLNPDGTFTLSHTYTQSGEFRVIVQITDNEGNIGVGEFVLQVTGP